MNQEKDEKIIKEFGLNLKNLREQKNLSLRQFADLADMNFGNIHEIEKGNVNPMLTTIVALAEALQVDPSQLITF
ncbi:helix-turn-helix domain-containing protein [Flavitalea flava]